MATMQHRVYLSILISLLFQVFNTHAQKIIIPEAMYFAGMKLNLSKGAREIVEKDFIAITKNQKYFTSITQRADLYFPIIEKVFREEATPPDFKYLALQESSLQSNVVSKSNAVGYWQFKKESAIEVGLQVDSEVDERMNIEASSRGAAKYLKKGNQVLNNWVYTLLAYYLGRGGVMPYVKEKYRNSNEMDIDEEMNWYVLRFLAHKYAYERVVGQLSHPQLRLALYQDCNGKSLKQIAEEKNIDNSLIDDYNKWLITKKVPFERTYTVILPYKIDQDLSGENVVFADKTEVPPIVISPPILTQEKPRKKKDKNKAQSKEELGFDPIDIPLVTSHNKLKAIQARNKDSFAKLAYAGNISVPQLLAHNDLESFDKPVAGEFYYLEPKRNKALVMNHTVQNGETIQQISQKYGIRIESIRKKNRMKMHENVYVGQLLFLTKKISKSEKKHPRTTPLFIKKSEDTQSQEIISSKNESQTIPTTTIEKSDLENKSVPPPSQAVPKDTNRLVVIDTRSGDDKEDIKDNTDSKSPITLATSEANTNTSNPSGTKITSYDVIKTQLLKDSITHHIVQSGQTLYFISRTYSTPVDSLKIWNNLQGNEISIGRQLIVKKQKNKLSESLSENNSIYIVKQGDTIYRIARMYGVSVDEILKWNNKETMILSIGENIKILK
ncbi:MAG: LysM peptidoglycan-binding domain-containing protein [Cytophagales bacterium]|nr:MAG: LysM peptidoglycan-binding domain-containing protein [Cytophagales bacterium]